MPVCLYNDLMLCSDQTRAILSYIKTTHVHVLGILYLIFDVHDWNLHVYCLGINEPIIVCFFVGFLISNDGSSIFKGKVFKFRYIQCHPSWCPQKANGGKTCRGFKASH